MFPVFSLEIVKELEAVEPEVVRGGTVGKAEAIVVGEGDERGKVGKEGGVVENRKEGAGEEGGKEEERR